MQNLNKTDLTRLESQIDTLLRTIHHLRLENSGLRNRLTQLEHELQQQEQKQQCTADKIEKITAKLKEAME